MESLYDSYLISKFASDFPQRVEKQYQKEYSPPGPNLFKDKKTDVRSCRN